MSEPNGLISEAADFAVTFKDHGNCEIFTSCPSGRSFLEALSAAWDNYRSAGHKMEEVWQVEISIIPF